MRQPQVLTFLRAYLPGFKSGGSLRTVASMVERLGDEIDFSIVTSDRDVGDAEPYPGIRPGTWQTVGKCRVLYLAPAEKTLVRLRGIVRATPHHMIYLNSFFDPAFTIRPLLLRRLGAIPKRPVILAPRGEFSPGALNLKRHKKRLYLAVARPAGHYADVTWHASSDLEAAEIRRWFGADAHVVVAPNIATPLPAATGSHGKQAGKLRLVFVSRIDRKKNLDGALAILNGLDGEITFDIYGPLADPGYWESCRRLAEALPRNIHVRYRGMVPHERIPAVLAEYDALFLPSRGENFGHAILEALAAGRPVIVSDRTPWRGLAERRAGWDLPLDRPAAFTEVLRRCVAMSAAEYAAWSEGARAHALDWQGDATVIDRNQALFRAVLSGAAPPVLAARYSDAG
jgi:glycosyltransferase involved in cell wall biosynthesis